jgi:organic radical activating enzyme
MGPRTALRVLEIFDSLQGEGYWTGTPMTFVRLAGCNGSELALGCTRWCDTREGWDPLGGVEMTVGEIMCHAWQPRLCLTGGEPLLQLEGVVELLAAAHHRDIRVHVETNGTIAPPGGVGANAALSAGGRAGGGFDWVTVSPKPPDYTVAPEWGGQVDELKLVADEALSAAIAERVAAAHPEAVVFIQPKYGRGRRAGSKAGPEASWSGRHIRPSRASAERAIALVMDHPDWRLSLQTHKLLGIR